VAKNGDSQVAIDNSLNAVAGMYGLPIIVSTHPRTRKMIQEKGIEFDPLVKIPKTVRF